MVRERDVLLNIQDVLLPPGGNLVGCTANETAALQVVARWILSFVCHPTPELGRAGVVCPFVPRSLQKRLLWLSVQRTQGVPYEQLLDEILTAGEVLRSAQPMHGTEAVLKAIVLVFPDVAFEEAPELLAGIHSIVKPRYVEMGSMIGEFWPTHTGPGRHNAAFHSLRSPFPLFVIRDMILDDIVHLSHRRSFVEAYLKKHQRRGCNEIFDYINRGEVFPPTPEQVATLLDLVHDIDPRLSRAPRKLDAVTGFAPAEVLAGLPSEHGAGRALVRIRLDNLAEIDAREGRPAADFLLWVVAQRLRKELVKGDVAVRSSDDGFSILTQAERAMQLSVRLQDLLGDTAPRRHGMEMELVASVDWMKLDAVGAARIMLRAPADHERLEHAR
jgi:GGDEF domain-containing protein